MSDDDKIENRLLGKNIPKLPDTNWDRIVGLIIIVCFFGIFGGWALISPLESAAIAPGKVVVAGYRRLIQHFEGGIIKAIYVKGGSVVQKGEKLIQLDDTRAKVSLDLVQNEFFELSFTEARLRAELVLENQFKFPSSLDSYRSNPKVMKIFNSQTKLYSANEKAFYGRIDILKQKIAQLDEQQKGEKAQLASFTEQLRLIKVELSEVKVLYNKRLIERSKLLSLMRESARLGGQKGEKMAGISSIQQKKGETQNQIISLKNQRRKELLTELRDTQSKLAEVTEKEKAAKDILERTTIRSPQTGTVVGLEVHTIGGVIKPGQTLMEIVPKHELLVIDAEVSLQDIDVVQPGLVAKVQLSALPTRTTPTLLGKVTHVSADTFQDEKTGRTYYRATVEIEPGELKKLGKQTLYPGMPAEVMIVTNRMTPFQYFIGPIKRSFDRAFKEQ